MGEDVPPEDYDWQDAKWYCISVDAFWDATPATGCGQALFHQTKCCRLGSGIKNWYAMGKNCTNLGEVCNVAAVTAQRITNKSGPYDTIGECNAVCGT